MRLIDTHCHLTSPELTSRLDAVLDRARQVGVDRVICVATDLADTRKALELMAGRPELYLVAGLHPHQIGPGWADELEAMAQLLRGVGLPADLGPRLVGWGETGLDFYYHFSPAARQEQAFRAQLELATALGLPVVIHARRSEARVCELLTGFPQLRGRVVFHCFSGDVALARQALEQEAYFSLTGVVTFKNAQTIQATARFLPQDRIMVETDAPYLSPEPVRRSRPNQPAFLVHTVRFLADLRGQDPEELAAITTANAVRFFRLREG